MEEARKINSADDTSAATYHPEDAFKNKVEEAKEYTIKFLKDLGLSLDLFGGIKKLDPKFLADIVDGKIYFNKNRIGELSFDLIERIAGHEAQHLKTEELKERGLKLNELYKIDEFKRLQDRIGNYYDKISKTENLPHTKEEYQEPEEVLSRLRAYQVYRRQRKEKVKVEKKPREFIEAFEKEGEKDLKFLDKDYLFHVTGSSAVTETSSSAVVSSSVPGGIDLDRKGLRLERRGSASPLISSSALTPTQLKTLQENLAGLKIEVLTITKGPE